MSQQKKIFFITLILITIIFLSNCKIIFYGIEQGIGEINLVHNAIPIDEIMQDHTYPDSLKEKLLLVQEIKKFAADSLGLNTKKNYNTVYDQKGEDIVWIIYGSLKYKVEAYKWKYPIVGRLPYKGYFKKEKALKEASRLTEMGYDTRVGTVSAWSTLGYFKDPILSDMLFKPVGELAELIIHESLHVTIYVKGEAQFNENMANFVGVNGAKLFLISKYGINSTEYKDYIGDLSDTEKYAGHFLRGAKILNNLYSTFNDQMTVAEKDTLKTRMISEIIDQLDTISFYNNQYIAYYQKKKAGINNAFFVGYLMYYNDLSMFENEYKNDFNCDLKKYISYLVKKYK